MKFSVRSRLCEELVCEWILLVELRQVLYLSLVGANEKQRLHMQNRSYITKGHLVSG